MAGYLDNQEEEEEIVWRINAEGIPVPHDGTVDLEAIRANLKLTPAERLEKLHERQSTSPTAASCIKRTS